jgi:hypothetical protein
MESDVRKLSDEQLCDDACWSTRERRTAACNTLLRRLKIMRELCKVVDSLRDSLVDADAEGFLPESFWDASDAFRQMEAEQNA